MTVACATKGALVASMALVELASSMAQVEVARSLGKEAWVVTMAQVEPGSSTAQVQAARSLASRAPAASSVQVELASSLARVAPAGNLAQVELARSLARGALAKLASRAPEALASRVLVLVARALEISATLDQVRLVYATDACCARFVCALAAPNVVMTCTPVPSDDQPAPLVQ